MAGQKFWAPMKLREDLTVKGEGTMSEDSLAGTINPEEVELFKKNAPEIIEAALPKLAGLTEIAHVGARAS